MVRFLETAEKNAIRHYHLHVGSGIQISKHYRRGGGIKLFVK